MDFFFQPVFLPTVALGMAIIGIVFCCCHKCVTFCRRLVSGPSDVNQQLDIDGDTQEPCSTKVAKAGKIGLAVVIANEYEKGPGKKLEGTAKDKERWEEAFRNLQFDVRTSKVVGLNASKTKMLRLIKSLSQIHVRDADYPYCRNVAFVFSGHGYSGGIVSEDGKYLDLERDVFPLLFCQELYKCRKLIFIDACRDAKLGHKGLKISASMVTKGSSKPHVIGVGAFVAYATLDRLAAIDSEDGSHFSKFTTEEIQKDNAISAVLDKAIGKVDEHSSGYYTRPEYHNQLGELNLYREAKQRDPNQGHNPNPHQNEGRISNSDPNGGQILDPDPNGGQIPDPDPNGGQIPDPDPNGGQIPNPHQNEGRISNPDLNGGQIPDPGTNDDQIQDLDPNGGQISGSILSTDPGTSPNTGESVDSEQDNSHLELDPFPSNLSSGEDVFESELNVSFATSSSQSGNPPLLGSQQSGSIESVTDGIQPDDVSNGVPDGVGLEPLVTTLESESSTSTSHPPLSGQDQSLVFQTDGGPDTIDGIQPDSVPNGVPDGVGFGPPVATLEPESSTSTLHPPLSGQDQLLVFQTDGGPDATVGSHLVHQDERDGPLVKSEDDNMSAHSSEHSRLCATDKPTEKELCTYVTTQKLIIPVWEKVCEGAGVSRREIDAVKRDHSTAPVSEVFFQCLRLWREGRTEHTKPVTWETLLTALVQAGLNDEAKHIEHNVLKLSDPLARKPTVMELQEHIIGSKTLRILQWETMCRLLGVESKEIESVKRDHPNDNVGAFRDCLRIWHKRPSGVTWGRLFEAVEAAGEGELVSEVKRKLGGAYMPKGTEPLMTPVEETEIKTHHIIEDRNKPEIKLKDFLKKWMRRIKSDAETQACVQDLFQEQVISEGVSTDIKNAKTRREANGLLYQHLCNQATVETMLKLYEVWDTWHSGGNDQQKKLSEEMRADMDKYQIKN